MNWQCGQTQQQCGLLVVHKQASTAAVYRLAAEAISCTLWHNHDVDQQHEANATNLRAFQDLCQAPSLQGSQQS
jgi:hypothetical protein